MENNIAVIPGYAIHEYLLVLAPHEELWNRIQKTKEQFANDFKAEQARWSKPYLTLVNFSQFKMMEERIINRLEKSIGGQPSMLISRMGCHRYPKSY